MKIVGLGDERRAAVQQICYLVGSVKAFKIAQFKSLLQSYEKQDATMHQILSEAVSAADQNYGVFLNAKIKGVSPKYSSLVDKAEVIDHADALETAMNSLRECLHDEMEYRREFLAPTINKVAETMNKSLVKVQSEEIRRQKLEAHAKSRTGLLNILGL